ncbi:MAG: hypothetical protein R2771_11705 [Saprospiraceae bacterium]
MTAHDSISGKKSNFGSNACDQIFIMDSKEGLKTDTSTTQRISTGFGRTVTVHFLQGIVLYFMHHGYEGGKECHRSLKNR